MAAGLLAACVDMGGPWAETLSIPVTGADKATSTIPARLCRPDRPGLARLVVLNHGSPGSAPERARYGLLSCDSALARHFLARGEAVLAPLRRGYGSGTGRWAEGYGLCADPDYVEAAMETGRDIRAAIAAARSLPGLSPEEIAVIGQSAGGWGVLGLAADPPPGVTALVAMAPGRGGRRGGRPNDTCRPDRLAEDAGRLGAGARLPVLWIHAAGDSFFAPGLVRDMHRANSEAGGRATLLEVPPGERDGHDLLYAPDGAARWGAAVDAWLDAHR